MAQVRSESEDDENFNEIYDYLLSVEKGKKVTQEILYLPPKESFKGGKEYLKAKKHFESNRFGKKRCKNIFAEELRYLKRLK